MVTSDPRAPPLRRPSDGWLAPQRLLRGTGQECLSPEPPPSLAPVHRTIYSLSINQSHMAYRPTFHRDL